MDMDRYFFTFFSLTNPYLHNSHGDFMSHSSLRVSSHLLDTNLGSMDELERAAAVPARSEDDFTEDDLEQREPGKDAKGSEEQVLAFGTRRLTIENIKGDAAPQVVEDAREKVSSVPKLPSILSYM